MKQGKITTCRCGHKSTRLVRIFRSKDQWTGKIHQVISTNEIDVCTAVGNCWKAIDPEKVDGWFRKTQWQTIINSLPETASAQPKLVNPGIPKTQRSKL